MKSAAIMLSAVFFIGALPVSSSESGGPLTPGGAAGVKQAQGESIDPIYIAAGAGAAIAIGILLALNNGGGGSMDCFVVLTSGSPAGCSPGPPITPPPITTTSTP